MPAAYIFTFVSQICCQLDVFRDEKHLEAVACPNKSTWAAFSILRVLKQDVMHGTTGSITVREVAVIVLLYQDAQVRLDPMTLDICYDLIEVEPDILGRYTRLTSIRNPTKSSSRWFTTCKQRPYSPEANAIIWQSFWVVYALCFLTCRSWLLSANSSEPLICFQTALYNGLHSCCSIRASERLRTWQFFCVRLY